MSYQLKQVMQQRRLRHPMSLKRQQGVVIIVALFIVALVATMSYMMMARLERDIRRTSLLLNNTQAEYYAQGSIDWAIAQLLDNYEKRQPNQIILDRMPLVSPTNEMNGYRIMSSIYDMQARFNLNTLTNAEALNNFKRLLRAVQPNLNDEKAREIILAISDWINPPTQESQKYEKYYLSRPLPYRTAHRPMLSMTELNLVKGVTPEVFSALKPYVVALPGRVNLVNFITAPAVVLLTLCPARNIDLKLDEAKALEADENKKKLNNKNYAEFLQKYHINPKSQDSNECVSPSSNFFLVETDVSNANQRVLLYSLLERIDKGDGKAGINIIWQSKGSW